MAFYKTYQGSRLDLEAYQGKATIDYDIEVFKDDGTAFDFSIYDSTNFKIYYRQHGELILTPTLTESGNSLLLDLTIAQSAGLQTREYWYECYGEFPSGEQQLISYGIFKVV